MAEITSVSEKQDKKTTIWTRGFICIMLSNVFANLGAFGVNTYLTSYMGFLDVGAALTGFISGLYYAVGLLMRPVSGPMQANMNKKRLMTATYALCFFVYLGYALFPGVKPFVVFRILHGVQVAFYGSLAMTIASASLPEEKISSGLGVFGLTGIVSQTFGPAVSVFAKDLGQKLGGELGGYRCIFFVAAFFGLLAVLPCFLLPDFDKNRVVVKDDTKWYKKIVAKEALMPSAVWALLNMATILFSNYLVPYGEWRGISNIGIYFTVTACTMVVTRPVMGAITDKYGIKKTFYPALAVLITGFVIISCATNTWMIILGGICCSLGTGTISPAVQAMTLQAVEPDRRAIASNTLYTINDIGYFLGPTLAGIVLEYTTYDWMFRCGLIPITIAAIVLTTGWANYAKNVERANEIAAKQNS